MNNILSKIGNVIIKTVLWIISMIFIVLGIVLIAMDSTQAGIFGLIFALTILPIGLWQSILHKIFGKKILKVISIIMLVCCIAMFAASISSDGKQAVDEAGTVEETEPEVSGVQEPDEVTSEPTKEMDPAGEVADIFVEETELTMVEVTADGYTGPECWIIGEFTDVDTKGYDVYAKIDEGAEREQTKEVIALLWNAYGDEDVMFKIYNGTQGISKKQPTYEELVAVWQNAPFSVITESQPTIIWYPEGGGVAAPQESEIWMPQ